MTEPTDQELIDHSEVIGQIVVLMEELAYENKTDDPVRDLYGVHLTLGRAVSDRMAELNQAAKARAAAEAKAKAEEETHDHGGV